MSVAFINRQKMDFSICDNMVGNDCTHLFDGAHGNDRERFWSLIKHQRKNFSTITSLKVDGQ